MRFDGKSPIFTAAIGTTITPKQVYINTAFAATRIRREIDEKRIKRVTEYTLWWTKTSAEKNWEEQKDDVCRKMGEEALAQKG